MPVWVPSVMMKAGRLPTAMPTPLSMPTARPATMATSIGTIRGTWPLPSRAASTPAKASVEPTDMSKPPEMITNIMPKASMPLMEACLSMLPRLRPEMKLGFMIVSTTTSAMKMIKMKYSLISALMFFLFSICPSRRYTAMSEASRMMLSCENASRPSSPERWPSAITAILSQTPISSGISEEISMTALPCCTSDPISR